MATVTLADFLDQLGNIPTNRILFDPLPGTATEEDVLEVERRTGLAPELIDGVLVEKTMGYKESLLAIELAALLLEFVRSRKLGIVLGPDGSLRILPGQIRLPDVCFISRGRFPGGVLPDVQIPRVSPDLAVEIISPGNTRGEMQRKLTEYFESGVRLVWYIDPSDKSARVFKAPDEFTTLGENDFLDGADVLPGFQLALKDLFAKLELEP
jgi:Uma2 family endonuclease